MHIVGSFQTLQQHAVFDRYKYSVKVNAKIRSRGKLYCPYLPINVLYELIRWMFLRWCIEYHVDSPYVSMTFQDDSYIRPENV